jgi:two-component system phosphate regulon sensor histidine kinase PhoR
MIKKIRTRIAFSYSLVIILLVVSLSVVFNRMARDMYLGIVRNEMVERARFIDQSFDLSDLPQSVSSIRRQDLIAKVRRVESVINMRVTIIDTGGVVIADSSVDDASSMDNHRYRQEIMSAMRTGTGGEHPPQQYPGNGHVLLRVQVR